MKNSPPGASPIGGCVPQEAKSPHSLEAKLEVAVRALEEIDGLAPTFEAVLERICPAGYLPTPGMERDARTLAEPFRAARQALLQIKETS